MNLTLVPRTAPTARSGRTFAGLATIAALILTIVTPGAVFAWDANAFSSADEQLLVTLTNQARAAAGLPSLQVDSTLTSIARWRSKDMIDRNYFSHSIPPDGKKVFDEMTRQGYCFKLAGENIGTNNFPDDIATETIQQGFMDSSGHRANILGPAWDVVGIGAYKGADGKHMWTVLFADKCGASATPAPTPAPTAAPAATPQPTPGPTAAPGPVATPRPTPRPTAAPVATPEPTPDSTPTPAPTATPEPTPDPLDPAEAAGALGTAPRGIGGGIGSDGPGNPGGPGPGSTTPPTTDPISMQIVDQPFTMGLVDSIVSDVAGGFFGN